MRRITLALLLIGALGVTGCTTADSDTESTNTGADYDSTIEVKNAEESDHEIPAIELPEDWPADAPLPAEYALSIVTADDPFFQADFTTPLSYQDAILFIRSEYLGNAWELATELDNETSYTFSFVKGDTKRTAAITIFEQQEDDTRMSIIISELIE